MRIAIISDIHGNYPALVAVVEDALMNNVDKFIFTGDYIFDLPFSNDVVHFLMELKNAYIIKGNKEAYLTKLANGNQDSFYNQMGNKQQVIKNLSLNAYNFLNAINEEIFLEINHDIIIYATHIPKFPKPLYKTEFGSLNFYNKMITESFSHEQYLTEFNKFINNDENKSLFNQINANIIIFGHNHLQSYAHCGNKLIINPGSCGLPFDFNPAAAYTILEITTNEINVYEKRFFYDINKMIDEAKKSISYESAKTWNDILFLSLKTGRDYLGVFLEIVEQISLSNNEKVSLSNNLIWEEASKILTNKIKPIIR
ncbi:MAG: metallophosphoesterase family protein [Defluviitaleaceae bacterium]|nr:metallophosphoesterase family protein [Defluviitaleaceae bacterium]